jgi:primosomal protein N' (replication factor Y)
VPIVVSAGERIVDRVGPAPAVVIATPGAEPRAEGRYAAVVLLDVQAALALPGLRSPEHAARRWFNAGGLARPGADLVIVAEPSLAIVQALIRWDPGWFAERELNSRADAGMPPARKVVAVTGQSADLDELLPQLPLGVDVLGPVPFQDRERLLLTTPHRNATALLERLKAFIVQRSALGGTPLNFRLDPHDLQ